MPATSAGIKGDDLIETQLLLALARSFGAWTGHFEVIPGQGFARFRPGR
jgi:hypothetical protein